MEFKKVREKYLKLKQFLNDFYENAVKKLQDHCSHKELEEWNETLPDCCNSVVFAYILVCKNCGKIIIK